MKRKVPLLTALVGVLTLAACGGQAAPASSPPSSPVTSPASVAASKPAAAPSTAASSKPAASTAPAASSSAAGASAKPAASSAAGASAKPAASGAAGASAKPGASGAPAGEGAAPPAAVRTPVVEVAKVPPGPPTPQVAQPFGAVPVSSRPPLPAKYSQSIGPYILNIDYIASAAPSTAGLLAVPGCVNDSVFKRGMRMVLRYSIYDSTNGKPVTDREGATTKINVAANQTVDGYFAPRGAPPPPPDAPWTWVGVWNVPTDFPLGNIDPKIALTTKDGKTTTLDPATFGTLPIQIVD